MGQDHSPSGLTRRTLITGAAGLAAGSLAMIVAPPRALVVRAEGVFEHYPIQRIQGSFNFTWKRSRYYGSNFEERETKISGSFGLLRISDYFEKPETQAKQYSGPVAMTREFNATYYYGTDHGLDTDDGGYNTYRLTILADRNSVRFFLGSDNPISLTRENGRVHTAYLWLPGQINGTDGNDNQLSLASYMPSTVNTTSGVVTGSVDVACNELEASGNHYIGRLTGSWNLTGPIASPSPSPSPSPDCNETNAISVTLPPVTILITKMGSPVPGAPIFEELEIASELSATGTRCPDAMVQFAADEETALVIKGKSELRLRKDGEISLEATYREDAFSFQSAPSIPPVIAALTFAWTKKVKVGTLSGDSFELTVDVKYKGTVRFIQITRGNAAALAEEFARALVVAAVAIAFVRARAASAAAARSANLTKLLADVADFVAAIFRLVKDAFQGFEPLPAGAALPALRASDATDATVLADLRTAFGSDFVAASTVSALSLERSQLAPGATLRYAATGLTPGGLAYLSLSLPSAPGSAVGAAVRVDGTGAIQGTMQIPPSGPAGRWLVTAIDITSMYAQIETLAAGTATTVTYPVYAATVTVQVESSHLLALTSAGAGVVTPIPTGPSYLPGTVVTLAAQPAANAAFGGWTVDGAFRGWANPLTLTVDTSHAVAAAFLARPAFADVTPQATGATEPIGQLAARGIIKGYDPSTFGPADSTLRAQMAALIARAMPGDAASAPGVGPQTWALETHGNAFPDRSGVDDALWRNVGTLAFYEVARGYGDGTYAPTNEVLNAQVISFITRALVRKGYWTAQPDDPALYPNVATDSGHRADLATYVHYAGPVRGTASATADFAGWDQPATRAWFAFALWQALDAHFGADRPGAGGYLP